MTHMANEMIQIGTDSGDDNLPMGVSNSSKLIS